MQQQLARLAAIAMLAIAGTVIRAGPALAHNGEAPSLTHTLADLAVWGAWAGAVLAATLGLFWLRAVALRKPRP